MSTLSVRCSRACVSGIFCLTALTWQAQGAVSESPAIDPVSGERQVIVQPVAPQQPAGQAMLGVIMANSPEGGVYVPDLYVGGPAHSAGLQVGDRIVEFNGEPITSTAQLMDLINRCQPAERVDLLVARRGWTSHLFVTLGNRATVATLPRSRVPEQRFARESRSYSDVGSDRWIDPETALNMYDPYRRALYTAYGP